MTVAVTEHDLSAALFRFGVRRNASRLQARSTEAYHKVDIRSGRMVNQNTGRGLLLGAVALIFLVQAPSYTIGSLGRPGPGLFPFIVSSTLLLIGAVIVVRSYLTEAVPLDFRIRNIALIAASLVGFALV